MFRMLFFSDHNLAHICQQSITMGSNSIDFLKAKPKHHGVEVLAVDLAAANISSGMDPNHFTAWYNYRHSLSDSCKRSDFPSDNATTGAGDNPQYGVMLILEAESLNIPLDSISDIQAIISKAIKNLGLTEMALSSNSDMDPRFFVYIMEEGYIASRVFAHEKYIAFDVFIWDDVKQIDEIKNALIEAVGGHLVQSTSSFYFVTAGMFGLQSPQKNVLAQIAADSQESFCLADKAGIPAEDDLPEGDKGNSMTTVLQDLVSFLKPRSLALSSSSVVGVLCGFEEGITCSSLQDLKNIKNVEVAPIFSCESFVDMPTCEKEILEKLQAVTAKHKRFDALVLDSKLPFSMGQILERLLRNKVTYSNLMEESLLVVTAVSSGEPWRTVLLDRFRTDFVIFDPAYSADVHFYLPDTGAAGQEKVYVKWSLFSSGDKSFFEHLATCLESIQVKTDMEYAVERVENGVINQIAEFKAKFFKDSDYDKTRALAQWTSQTPVGHQTIFQMAQKQPKTPVKMGERILAEIEPGPWNAIYGGAVVVDVLPHQMYSVRYDAMSKAETIHRDQIRKFSSGDQDLSTSFDVGDLILYGAKNGMYRNGVISKIEDDDTYSIYLLNTSGKKVYNVPRSRLIYQFESTDFVEELTRLSPETIKDAFKSALELNVAGEDLSAITSNFVAAGAVITAFWRGGSAILKWDGKQNVDVNLFTYEEDRDKSTRQAFQEAFCNQVDHMVPLTRDEHPRGYGAVVNFPSEIQNPPHWIVK
jgi:hypothetical protein